MPNEDSSLPIDYLAIDSNLSEPYVTDTFFPYELKFHTIEECKTAYSELIEEIITEFPNCSRKILWDTYQFAEENHHGQKRKDGTPYISHLIATAKIVSHLQKEPILIQSAILHDIIQDPKVTIDRIREMFGQQIAVIVDGVTKINELHSVNLIDLQAQNLRKMILAMSQDVRVILVKLADRLHNLTTIEFISEDRRLEIARETIDIYAPLAHRLGIWWMKWRLEDLCFKVLDRDAYNEIRSKVSSKREHREEMLQKTVSLINSNLLQHDIKSEVKGRAKHFYSIYKKMTGQGRSFDNILDLLAIRIIVDSVDQCYIALGIVHNLYTPNHEFFYDFIASPKSNGYRSIHTKVIGPKGHIIEVQIRTREMDRESEFGLASHYVYKEGTNWDSLDNELSQWMRLMMDSHKDNHESEEILQVLKTESQPKEIFVISPKGEVFRLPKGSSPIDYAFLIHSDIGFHAIAAKVNGKMHPLLDPLPYGCTIEIITSEKATPATEWLTRVKTSRARSVIKRYFQEIRLEDSKKLGIEILQSELNRLSIEPIEFDLLTVANQLGFDELPLFYAAIGSGTVNIENVIRKLLPQSNSNPNWFTKLIRWKKSSTSSKLIKITGSDNTMITLATCCLPLPGDRIQGFLSKGLGVLIHRMDCKHAVKIKDQEQLIEVTWDVNPEALFKTTLQVTASDRKGMLADITTTLSESDVSIIRLKMALQEKTAVGFIEITVKSLSQLSKLIKRMNSIEGVIRVQRVEGNYFAE